VEAAVGKVKGDFGCERRNAEELEGGKRYGGGCGGVGGGGGEGDGEGFGEEG